jgi:hypothetical protein
MTPVEAIIKQHDPDAGQCGDCWRACIASMLDLPTEAVPHFAVDAEGKMLNGEDASLKLMEFLRPLGFSYVEVPFSLAEGDTVDDALTKIGAAWMRDVHWTLLGKSKRGFNHVVVCRGAKVVHDPTYGDPHGIVGPAEDGYFWGGWIAKL